MYSIDSFITTLWSKHPYQRTVRKLSVNENIYHFWYSVPALDFWLAFLHTLHKKMKFSIKDFFSKCDLMKNFIFCAVIWFLNETSNLAIINYYPKNFGLGNIFSCSIVETKILKWLIKTDI